MAPPRCSRFLTALLAAEREEISRLHSLKSHTCSSDVPHQIMYCIHFDNETGHFYLGILVNFHLSAASSMHGGQPIFLMLQVRLGYQTNLYQSATSRKEQDTPPRWSLHPASFESAMMIQAAPLPQGVARLTHQKLR
jgi:hypothetical protein